MKLLKNSNIFFLFTVCKNSRKTPGEIHHLILCIATCNANVYNTNKMKISHKYEWDEAKRQGNIGKHKIDFIDAVQIFEGEAPIYTFPDTRKDWGEDRFVTIGLLHGIEIAVVHTPRGHKRRIISVRRARKEEREKYYREVLTACQLIMKH